MLYLFLLVFFLIQFLVILGVVLFAIFFARPEVPLAGNGKLELPEADALDQRSSRRIEEEPPSSGKNASRDSRVPASQFMPTQSPAFAAFPYASCEGLYQTATQAASSLTRN